MTEEPRKSIGRDDPMPEPIPLGPIYLDPENPHYDPWYEMWLDDLDPDTR